MKRTLITIFIAAFAIPLLAQPKKSKGDFGTGAGSAGSAGAAGSAGSAGSSSSNATYWNNRTYKASGYMPMPMPEKSRKPATKDTNVAKLSKDTLAISHQPAQIKDTLESPLNMNFEDAGSFIPASYPGGKTAFAKQIKSLARIPKSCLNNGVRRGAVDVWCTIDSLGNITANRTRNYNPVCREMEFTARRVIYETGKWNPATRNEIPVRSEILLTVNFDED